VLEIDLQTNETIVPAVLGTLPQSIQSVILNSNVATDQGLWKTDSSSAFGLGIEGL
jgi:hypothetical protein